MSTYETDFYRWTQETAELLKRRKFTEIDLEALIEEVEDMGKSRQRALKSRLTSLLLHLLKWQYQPTHRGRSWQQTLRNQRKGIKKELKANPSLKPKLTEIGEDAYDDAIGEAALETGFEEDTFPATFADTGWTWEKVLDMDWLPE
ncbi:MAG: DUF29 domain-containing protein [Candidatus Nitrosoglobus sp.]